MSYIISSPCVGVCDTACVAVCPVDCIHGPVSATNSGGEVKELKEKENGLKDMQLYIDPDVCIDCGACVPECPVDAIYVSEADVPANEKEFIKKNYEFFGRDCPPEYLK